MAWERGIFTVAVLRLLKTTCQLSGDDAAIGWETYTLQYEVEGEHVWLQDEPWILHGRTGRATQSRKFRGAR